MLQKLSKYEVKATRYGHFSNLLPLRFYVKSNSDEMKCSKMPFLPILEVLNCDFSEFKQFFNSKFTKLQSSEFLKWAKMTFLDSVNSPKFDFT